MKRIALAVAAAMIATPVAAKTKFEALETRAPMIEIGKGGTRTQKHGIDFWTSGTPPIRFQVIGIITDTRGNGKLSGDAVGSKSIAKLVLQHGGNGVIILAQGSKATGVISGGQASAYGNNAYGSGWSAVVGETRTSLAVIKYLSDEPPPIP